MSTGFQVIHSVSASAPVESHQVVFILDTLPDVQTLIAAAPKGSAVVLLDGRGDALQAMADYLQTVPAASVDAIHLFSHGSTGSLQLGSLTLDSTNLQTYGDALRQLGSALSEQGDLLLYGCNVAGDETGRAFIDELAQLTGADVAASEDLTGNAALGGDWELEAASGSIEAETLAPAGFSGQLADVNNALDFDGTDDYASTGLRRVDLGDNYTVEGWFRFDGDVTDGYSAIIGSVDSDGIYGTRFFIGKNELNSNFGIEDGEYKADMAVGTDAFDGEWHHFAFTSADRNGILYLDGVVVGTHTFTIAADNDGILIGAELESYGFYFDGQIDEVRFWNDVRTVDEIRDNMFQGLSDTDRADTSLVAYYPFENIFINTLPDFSSNDPGHPGTLVNMDSATDVVDSTTYNNWLGTTSTDWNTTTNWSLGSVPTDGQNVSIDTTTNLPTIPSGAKFGSLYLGSGVNTSLAGDITVNGSLLL
ncbi:MAG: DUF4347 domain-containing protein, partial [Desulfuromonadaceae bacterium]|nr:DUF4347 domain-containing protein [Desulfuromonadaceae bacterium]